MKEKETTPLKSLRTKKQITQGRKVHVPKYYKGIMTTFKNKADKRLYLNMVLDMLITQEAMKKMKVKEKDTGNE